MLAAIHVDRAAKVKLQHGSKATFAIRAISSFTEGSDVFVVLPTGYGNSLCYACLHVHVDMHSVGRSVTSRP